MIIQGKNEGQPFRFFVQEEVNAKLSAKAKIEVSSDGTTILNISNDDAGDHVDVYIDGGLHAHDTTLTFSPSKAYCTY